MKNTINNINLLKYVLFFLMILLIIEIFKWVDFLIKNKYLQKGTYLEFFTNNTNNTNNANNNTIQGSNYVSGHAVDMPYFAEYTCNNWCGPLSQCLFTRENCTSDRDCTGCKDLTKLNNIKKIDIYDLGQEFMDVNGFNPKGAPEDILQNEYLRLNKYTAGN